ncbi:MAG: molybdenum cofactor guanylyltransferase [Brevundimonas sp.]|uniref:Molybdenum cofactor guanylyltransferase n=1 Tax=Brevundimonas albigilva TaxID=1312364 RepID=A0ABY4SQP1_9CAUL|nr:MULTISPECIES: molybdenum cofactor guanylyltransferase [Brevundimonas]MCV0416559.1 molybdenum cofactor guanylyltransferase [Brevundimonas sp.]URI15010.1 molybdenum cofactor guanylyltransferase [Brevundimonas albigilva]
MTSAPDHIAVVVLAGGEGRRIGGGKPLRRLAGQTLLDRALAQARTVSDMVAVAVRDPAQAAGVDGARLIPDAPWEGPLGGLAAALVFARQAGRTAVLTLPCDMPLVPPDLAGRLTAALDGHGAALASSGGRLHPVCGLWRTDRLGALSAYAATGQRSLKGFAAGIGFVAVDWPAEPVDPFFNVNTAADLGRAEALLA